MTPKEFARYLERDFNRCVHCGIEGETLVINHRANRGFGGSKSRNRPSNLVVICSAFNTAIESDPASARLARERGIKLESWEDPLEVPIWDAGQFWLLDDEFGRFVLLNYDEPA